MGWTNKNRSKIIVKPLDDAGTWYRLEDRPGTDCSEVVLHSRGGEAIKISADFSGDIDNVPESPPVTYWTIHANSSSEQESFRITGITNTCQISASSASASTKLEAICRFYTGHVQTG